MTDSGNPDEPQDPFAGLPFFADLSKLLSQQGAVSWGAASQLGVAIANEGQTEPNVDPIERMKLEQLARVAELKVADATGLATTTTGAPVSVAPVNRTIWVQRTLPAYRPLVEKLATALSTPPPGTDVDAGDPTEAMLGGMMKLLGPMMLGMTAGSMVGHLAQRSLGQYDLPIPRPPSDELMVVVPNIDRFGEEWSIAADDLRLWVCLHEVAHHAVLGVPHVRRRLTELLEAYVSAFRPDPNALEEKLGTLDLTRLTDADGLESLQDAIGDPDAVLGLIQSDEQRALIPALEALVTVVVGYVDHVMDVIGTGLIGSYPMLTEALRRRRVEASSADRFVERLLGLELTQPKLDRANSFVDGVVERGGEEGLARLFASERNLPTPNEVDAPGLWLARIDLPD